MRLLVQPSKVELEIRHSSGGEAAGVQDSTRRVNQDWSDWVKPA
jgi:hypothetical protein